MYVRRVCRVYPYLKAVYRYIKSIEYGPLMYFEKYDTPYRVMLENSVMCKIVILITSVRNSYLLTKCKIIDAKIPHFFLYGNYA